MAISDTVTEVRTPKQFREFVETSAPTRKQIAEYPNPLPGYIAAATSSREAVLAGLDVTTSSKGIADRAASDKEMGGGKGNGFGRR